MSLFIGETDGVTSFRSTESQQHIIAISVLDTGVGFDGFTTAVEGVTCRGVTYVRTQPGPTAVRLDALVHDTGFIGPEAIVAHGVDQSYVIAGFPITSIAGIALPRGDSSNPYTNHIATFYDTSQCNGSGYWVDKDGGGTTSFPSDVILYHELAHCFHFATGVVSTEPLAEIDENDMRDVRSIDHRNTASHTGGCGGGPVNCCIVASIATDSTYSGEIKRFRQLRDHTLRRSIVGDAFFEEFFRRYYEFSPEVTRLMGREPNLKPIVKSFFVMPLLSGFEMLIHYADHKGEGLDRFLAEHLAASAHAPMYAQDYLDKLKGYLRMARSADNDQMLVALVASDSRLPGASKLLRHINRETLDDEYIDWSLVSVVQLWLESALLLVSGIPQTDLNRKIYEKITTWVSLLPISNAWCNLSGLETEQELRSLGEQFLFDAQSRRLFSDRLIKRSPRYKDRIRAWASVEGA